MGGCAACADCDWRALLAANVAGEITAGGATELRFGPSWGGDGVPAVRRLVGLLAAGMDVTILPISKRIATNHTFIFTCHRMLRLSPLDPGSFTLTNPISDGCHAAWTASFELSGRIYTITFEASKADKEEYRPFCKEQSIECAELHIVKFDHEFNVMPEDAFRRIPEEFRLSAAEMIALSRFLIGGVIRFAEELAPHVIVGLPNDSKLERWYARLSRRIDLTNHLIGMRHSAYHRHQILVIHRS
jgi:hypothetical protein